MIVNPYVERLPVFPGTRILATDFGLVGTEVIDQTNTRRTWTVTSVYAPITERCLGGVRIKLVDQKNFTTFCNQRDFEVLIGIAQPEEHCIWAGKPYMHPHDAEWFGFCMDPIDLQDDLYERELALRDEKMQLPPNSEVIRRIHANTTRDAEDFWILNSVHPGMEPDVRLETVYDRWCCVSRDWLDWTRI
jgi:hypothetical protein